MVSRSTDFIISTVIWDCISYELESTFLDLTQRRIWVLFFLQFTLGEMTLRFARECCVFWDGLRTEVTLSISTGWSVRIDLSGELLKQVPRCPGTFLCLAIGENIWVKIYIVNRCKSIFGYWVSCLRLMNVYCQKHFKPHPNGTCFTELQRICHCNDGLCRFQLSKQIWRKIITRAP